jgi:hypothetical protein
VVYRGRLGQEQDGIAVGRLDVPEPTFLADLNMTDYYGENGTWHVSSPSADGDRRPDVASSVSGTWIDVPGVGPAGAVYASLAPVPAARFTRVAVIGRTDPGQYRTTLQFARDPSPRVLSSGSLSLVRQRQAAAEEIAAGEYHPTPLFQVRGIGFDRMHFFYYGLDTDPLPDIATLPALAERTALEDTVLVSGAGAANAFSDRDAQCEDSSDRPYCGSESNQ